jgi:hypothetical protein
VFPIRIPIPLDGTPGCGIQARAAALSTTKDTKDHEGKTLVILCVLCGESGFRLLPIPA